MIQSVWGGAEAAFPTSLQVRQGCRCHLEWGWVRFQIVPPAASISLAWMLDEEVTGVPREKGTQNYELGSAFSAKATPVLGCIKWHQEISLRAGLWLLKLGGQGRLQSPKPQL